MPSSLFSSGCRTAVALLILATAVQAGIQGSGFRRVSALARVSGFDDGVVVDGVRFETSRARVLIDGQPASASQLQPGQLVAVVGKADGSGAASAEQIAFVSDVQGVVGEVSERDGSFQVLGQTIRVVDTTLFGDGIHPARLKGIRPGMSVAVSAFPSASGELIASRVVLAESLGLAQTRGRIEALDDTSRTFRINDLTVEYAAALITGSLANGAVVTVRGRGSSIAGALVATEVQVNAAMSAAAGVAGAIEGLVTRFDSNAQFDVNGQRVAAGPTTQFELHGATLDVDQRVDVNGSFDAAGVLIADRIEIEPVSLAEVAGFVEAVSLAEGIVRVQGVELHVTADTILEDRATPKVHDFRLSDLRVGDYMDVRGVDPAAVLQRERAPRQSRNRQR